MCVRRVLFFFRALFSNLYNRILFLVRTNVFFSSLVHLFRRNKNPLDCWCVCLCEWFFFSSFQFSTLFLFFHFFLHLWFDFVCILNWRQSDIFSVCCVLGSICVHVSFPYWLSHPNVYIFLVFIVVCFFFFPSKPFFRSYVCFFFNPFLCSIRFKAFRWLTMSTNKLRKMAQRPRNQNQRTLAQMKTMHSRRSTRTHANKNHRKRWIVLLKLFRVLYVFRSFC